MSYAPPSITLPPPEHGSVSRFSHVTGHYHPYSPSIARGPCTEAEDLNQAKLDANYVTRFHPPRWGTLALKQSDHIQRGKKRDYGAERTNSRRRRNMVLVALLVLILIYLLANVIFLNVRVMRSSSQPPPSLVLPPLATATANVSDPNALATDAQACLSQFSLNAPSNPQAYPCSSCLTSLQNVPSSFAAGNPRDGQQILNAIQFCGLRSIFENANGNGQIGFSNTGWTRDLLFCAWSGVRCDGNGRVSSLELTFPAVPARIPDELGALTGLTSLKVVGDTNIPAGDFPTSLQSLNTLATLHLESTALPSLRSDLLRPLTKLNTVTLVKNAKMTSDMTVGLTSLPLQNLVINGQALPSNLVTPFLTSSAGRTIRTLDLSSTSIQGSLPGDLSAFNSLVELHLDNNALSNPLPSKFPAGLQALSLANNSQLTGAISTGVSFCGLTHLQTCDVRGSGLTALGGCSVCRFT